MTNPTHLRARRESLGLTREQLASRIKNPARNAAIASMSLVRWELGKVIPGPVLLERWIAALDKAEKARKA